ncbi:MAG: hypothetical protein ACRBBM_12510 [Pseudomonadaceae bacterium]
MAELPLDQAVARFQQNERRINQFVNDSDGSGEYETLQGDKVPALPVILPEVRTTASKISLDASRAETAATTASVASKTFDNIVDGIANTVSGQLFLIRTTDPQTFDVWLNDLGVALDQNQKFSVARTSDVQEISEAAGFLREIESTDIRVVTDTFGNVAMRIKGDGTNQVLGLEVGGWQVQQQPDGSAEQIGVLGYEGVTETRALQLYGEFEDAVKVIVDEAFNVIYAEMPDGEIRTTETAAESGSDANFLTYKILPDAFEGRNPPGFTCTGLDRITRGVYAGCWIIGDDGRLKDSGDLAAYIPRVHIVDPECARILFSFNPMPGLVEGLPRLHSVQGVAIDTSGEEDTVWISTASEGFVRHFRLDGTEIAADAFQWTYASQPNGIAYDPVNHAFWVTPISGREARLVSCSPGTDRLLQTVNLTSYSPDQLHYHSEQSLLYYSVGANGTSGDVRVKNLLTGVDSIAYAGLLHAQAIEGLYIDRQNSTLSIVNDAGFHLAGRPQFNILISYKIS